MIGNGAMGRRDCRSREGRKSYLIRIVINGTPMCRGLFLIFLRSSILVTHRELQNGPKDLREEGRRFQDSLLIGNGRIYFVRELESCVASKWVGRNAGRAN